MDIKKLLAINARCGDGSFWKHPECRNYKLVFTGTNRQWLSYKGSLIGREPTFRRKANCTRKGVYPNAKELWCLTTLSDPLYTRYKFTDNADIIEQLTLNDMLLWFLDDGCTIAYKGKHDKNIGYRYFLCIGNFLTGVPYGTELFLERMRTLYDVSIPGSVCRNNSKATANNLVWRVPVKIGRSLVAYGKSIGIPGFEHKLRSIDNDQTSETISKESRLPGFKAAETGKPH